MPRRYVKELLDQEQVDEIYRLNHKQFRPNRSGALYLQADVSDRSGTISALLWNAEEGKFRDLEAGDYVRVRGTAQLYQGMMQILAQQVSKARGVEVDESEFFPLAPKAVDKLIVQLSEHLRGLKDPHLKGLAECFLIDAEFMRKYSKAPAGIKNHHAYHGGLLEHVVSMMDAASALCKVYPQLNRDLLLMGVFLHDLGKIDELEYEKAFGYTDVGQMVGHVVMAVETLAEKVKQAEELSGEPLPPATVLQLKHMIVSHHGEYEFGAPKLPMTLEALALYHIDNLDAKLHSFAQLIHDDPNVEGSFTLYQQNLGRKLYKGKS